MDLPEDTDQLAAYLRSMLGSGRIAVGPTARRIAGDLLGAGSGLAGLVELPLRIPVRLVTAGLLPPAIREAYELRWTPAHRAAFTATAAACRRARPLLAESVCRWPEALRPTPATSTIP